MRELFTVAFSFFRPLGPRCQHPLGADPVTAASSDLCPPVVCHPSGGRVVASAAVLDRAAFADQVRDALSRLYDPVHLQNHALADLLAARGLAPTERDARAARGRRLGQELRDAIDAMK